MRRLCFTSRFGLSTALLILFQLQIPLHAQNRTVRIGVIIDGPWHRNAEIADMTRSEILALTADEFDVQFPPEKQIVADWTIEGIRTATDQLLADPQVDLVLTMGVIASNQICKRGALPKPVIAPFVIDADLQGLPMQNGASGVRNLNYLSLPSHVVRDIRVFQEIVQFYHVTILFNDQVVAILPDLAERTSRALSELEIESTIVPVSRSIDATLAALDDEVEAVYLAPLLHLSTADWDKLVSTLRERKIPTFSLLGRSEVERGVMATGTPEFFPKLARRVALNLQQILLGEEPGSLPVSFAIGERVIINVAVARAIGVSPPFAVLTEAVLINEQRTTIERHVNLLSAMREAVDVNLDLLAEQFFVAAGKQNINLARANLLPQIEVSATGLAIDKDRAQASFGSQAERSVTGSLRATQLIFSDPARANLSIQKNVQITREQALEQLRLDITQAAATAFLNVLRAKTFETLQKENLGRTRSNWELAQVRESIGYSGRSEVYRWESEIANLRKEVISANAQRNLAEIALNQLLHHPLEEPFQTIDEGLLDLVLSGGREDLLDYFDDPVSFKTFRAFLAEEGMINSPEIKSLDAAIAAKERAFRSTGNAFWAPTLALQFEVSRILAEGGAGVTGLELLPTIPITFPETDDTNWSLAVSASLPLFEGGSRFAQRARTSSELQELQTERESAVRKIEQRIRSALHLAGASHAGIQLSRDAADAARQNLDLVTDAYSNGAIDILDLLDAQNAALNADLAASNAVFDFVIDLMEVERSVGGFYLLASPEEQEEMVRRLREYFEKAGVAPGGK